MLDALNDATAAMSAVSPRCPTAGRLFRKSIHSKPIVVMPRVLPPEVLTALDAVPPARLPRLRLVGKADHLRNLIDKGLAEVGFGPRWLAEWLSEDVTSLARLLNELTKTRQMRLRLEAVSDDACQKFHIDNVHFRLVSTYRGPGTEWLAPDELAPLAEGADVPADGVRRLERGHLAMMRGAREANARQPGLFIARRPSPGLG